MITFYFIQSARGNTQHNGQKEGKNSFENQGLKYDVLVLEQSGFSI